MVAGWRKDWGRGELPFYYVQIAPYHYGRDSTTKVRNACTSRNYK